MVSVIAMLGIYLAIFIGIPLCNFLYRKLEPKIGRSRDKNTAE